MDENRDRKIEQDITVEEQQFSHVKDRLMGGKVFTDKDRSAYLRTGGAAEILGEINLVKELYDRGFPVPKLLGTGTLPNGDAYYIEKSIGERVFGDIFREETKISGHVSDASFDEFTGVIRKYCEAQFNPDNFVPHNQDALAQMVVLPDVMKNHPPSHDMKEMFVTAYERASQRVLSLPWGYIQSDFNAFNILHEGIIDFELVGFGPVGYDVITNAYFGRMWPADRVAYVFTDAQIARYVAAVDVVAREKNLPTLSPYVDDFLILKVIWATGKAKGSDSPEFLAWRVRVRDWCIKRYLSDKKIDTSQFESAGKIV